MDSSEASLVCNLGNSKDLFNPAGAGGGGDGVRSISLLLLDVG